MAGDWYAGVRVLHVLFAALWVGTAVLLTFYVSPAIRALGPRGAPLMAELMRRRMGAFIAAVSGITIVSGLWMYWVFSHGFQATIMDTGAGLALAVGGTCGILAAIIGGAVIGRSAERAGSLSREASQLPQGEQRDALLGSIAVLQRRVAWASRCDVALLLAALVAMCIAHVV